MYYTRKYIQLPNLHLDEPLNTVSTTKRFNIPTKVQLCKPATNIILSTPPIKSLAPGTNAKYHCILSPSDASDGNNSKPYISTGIKPIVRKSHSTIGISRCDDDQKPLLTSERVSTVRNSTNCTARKCSLNAFLPLAHSANVHPVFSSSTSTVADDSNKAIDDDNKNRNRIGLKSHRRISLSSTFRRNTSPKRSQTLNSTATDQIILPSDISFSVYNTTTTTTSNNNNNNQLSIADSDSSDQTSLLKATTFTSKKRSKKNSFSVQPVITSTISPYRKDFMQKIERFRFIDDSASSTTTIASPVESIDRINGQQPCSHQIISAIEQFDDYVRSRYYNNDEINSYIDRLNSDVLKNGSYSELNMLNSINDNKTIQHSQTKQRETKFIPVKNRSSQLEKNNCRQTVFNSAPITIPSQHFKHTPSSDNTILRPTTTIPNGHSRSMDFQSISNNNNRQELPRPSTLINTRTIHETSSSSTPTLISTRSSYWIEFDDDTKPSGVLVDDDFLPMSSPIDEHFWNMTIPQKYYKFDTTHKNECFPNVGSSPDVEVKHFDINTLSSTIDQLLSETSCDEDDENALLDQQKFSIHEYKLNKLQKPIVIHQSLINPSSHSKELPDANNVLTTIPIDKLSLEHKNDESLLEKFASTNTEFIHSPIRSPPLHSSTTAEMILSSKKYPQTIYEEDDAQESSTNDNLSDESADNGEIDLVHEFELSQKNKFNDKNNLWNQSDHDVFILQEDDILSAFVTTQTQTLSRPTPPSIMKITHNKSIDSIDDQQSISTTNILKPKVRFNLDPQYEQEREWNKVNKLLGNSVEWTDEFEV